MLVPGARCSVAVSFPAMKPWITPRPPPIRSEIGTTRTTLCRLACVMEVIENAFGASIRNANEDANPQKVAGTLLISSKRDARTMKKEAIPAASADETEAWRWSQPPATLMATSHAMKTPKTRHTELVMSAFRFAPDWS